MRFYRYEAFESTVQVSLTGRASVDGTATVEVFINAPVVGRLIARWRPRAPQWLRDRVSAQVSGAVFAPSYGCPIWSAVVRCGFFDRVVGDVPIAWEWYSDGRKVDRAAERAAQIKGE